MLPVDRDGTPSVESLSQRLLALIATVQSGDRRLLDLEFLAWQAQVWPLAARSAGARDLLASGWTNYAEWLTWDGRVREANVYANRVLDLVRTKPQRTGRLISQLECALLVSGRVLAQGTGRDAKANAVKQLQMWLPGAGGTHLEVMLYNDMAEHAWWAGETDAAVAFSQRSYRLAERSGNAAWIAACGDGRADLFLRLGQPEKARDFVFPPAPEEFHYLRIGRILRWVRLGLALNDPTAADWLAEAYALIEKHGYHRYRPSAEALTREF